MTKTILMIATLISTTAMAQMAPPSPAKVISSRTVTLPVDLNEKTVLLSSADYSVPVVKVLVPGLAAETVMNHQNTAAGAPCLATRATREPAAVLAGKPALENIRFKIVLTKDVFQLSPDPSNPDDKNTCQVSLTETVTATIRGLPFTHQRTTPMPSRPASDCQ